MGKLRQAFANLKIKQKIMWFSVGSIFLLSMIFLAFYGKAASNTVLARARNTTRENLSQIESYLQEVNLTVSSRLSHLGTSISIQQVLRLTEEGRQEEAWSVQGLLRDVQMVDQIEFIELYTLEGAYVAGTVEDRDGDWSPSQKVLEAVRAVPGQNYWHDDGSYVNSRTDCMAIYRAICAEPGVPIGVARVRLSLSALSDLYNYVGFGTAADIYLFTGRGNLLLPRETSPAVLRVGRDRFAEYIGGVQGEKETYAFRNQRYLVQSLPLPKYDLYIAGVAAYSRLMEDVYTLQISILLLGVICILAQLCFFGLMGNALSRPITDLSRTMEQVKAGNLGLRSANCDRDEIGMLSQNFNHMLERIEQLVEENAASEKRRHELELIALQTQITPHFLYNSLDSVSALVQMGDMEGAFQMSKALGGFYRGVLSDGRSVISVEEELQMTDGYLRVQSQRYRDGFDYRIQVAREIRGCAIVKLIIQPLVENAIYHGLRKVRRRGLLVISGRVEDGEAILAVEDNGAGMPQERNPFAEEHCKGDLILHRKGYGMYNADQRVKLYFGDKYGLSVRSAPGVGTRVEIRMPLCPYKEYQHDFDDNR